MGPDGPLTVQVIDGGGTFCGKELEDFSNAAELSGSGISYAVAAIVGPQSSGKSTLMNHLFGTRFVEMNAQRGRSQTTHGVWMARADGVEPPTFVLDLEGTDSRERGEDDTTFEKQSSLFALAVSDILLINIWCHDIGREVASNKPLLKVVFQMMMRLFTPRKTTLIFVIRDKTKTPLEFLELTIRSDINAIWENVQKPPKHQHTKFEDLFKVEIVALAHYEEKFELFTEQVDALRERFQNSTSPGGLAGDRSAVVPGSGFVLSAQEIWKVIKENKDLDLPAHKTMVATVRCEEIAKEKLAQLHENKEWLSLLSMAQEGPVPAFGKTAGALFTGIMAEYDTEATYFEETVRIEKRKDLGTQVLETLHSAFSLVLAHRRTMCVDKFKVELVAATAPPSATASSAPSLSPRRKEATQGFAAAVRKCVANTLAEFDKGAAEAMVAKSGWDVLRTRQKLQRDMDAHAAIVRSEKRAAVQSGAEGGLTKALTGPATNLLETGDVDTWPSLQKLFKDETLRACQLLLRDLAGYELSDEEEQEAKEQLVEAGRMSLDKLVQREADQAVLRMKERFNTIFSRDADSMPRLWTSDEDIRLITRTARTAALKLLAVLAVNRIDGDTVDGVEAALGSLLEGTDAAAAADARSGRPGEDWGGAAASKVTQAIFSATTWDGVPPSQTLLPPTACITLWRQFKAETEFTISQALAAQAAHKKNNSWLPPPWAIVAMVVLGWNEFMMVLRNPLFLLVGAFVYFFGKALLKQMDIGNDFQLGIVPGLLALGAKFIPAMMSLLKRLIEEAQGHGAEHQERSQQGVQLQDFSGNSSSVHKLNGTAITSSSRLSTNSTVVNRKGHTEASVES